MKNKLPQVGFEPMTLHSALCTLDSGQMLLPTELPRQPTWLGPNQTSHTPV